MSFFASTSGAGAGVVAAAAAAAAAFECESVIVPTCQARSLPKEIDDGDNGDNSKKRGNAGVVEQVSQPTVPQVPDLKTGEETRSLSQPRNCCCWARGRGELQAGVHTPNGDDDNSGSAHTKPGTKPKQQEKRNTAQPTKQNKQTNKQNTRTKNRRGIAIPRFAPCLSPNDPPCLVCAHVSLSVCCPPRHS